MSWIFRKKSDEGNTSKIQDFEFLEGMECNDISKINDSNKDGTSKNISGKMDLNKNSENDSCRDDSSENISKDVEHNNNSETNDSNR